MAGSWWNDPDTLDRLVDLVGYASIVSAACFGVIGLFTDYKKDGRTTGWGKAAAAGIMLSAALGLTSSTLSRRAEAHKTAASRVKADRERKEADERYRSQLARLVGISNGLIDTNTKNETIIDGVARTLAEQSRLFQSQRMVLDRAQQTMLLTTRLSQQEGENTGRVLKSLWDGANRLTGDRVQVQARVFCESQPAGAASLSFADGLASIVLFKSQGISTRDRYDRTMYSVSSEATHASGSGSINNTLLSFTIFRSFVAYSSDQASEPETWRGSMPRVTVSAPVSPAALSGNWNFRELDERQHRLSKEFALKDFKRLPCKAEITLFANGRIVVEGEASIGLAPDSTGANRIWAQLAPTPIEESAIPTYGEQQMDAPAARPISSARNRP